MLVVANVALDGCYAHTGHIDVPAVDKVALGHGAQDTSIDRIAVHDFELGKSDALFKTGRSADTRDHHQLNKLLGLHGQLAALSLFEAVFGRRYVFRSKGLEEHLQLVLPKLLLFRLVEEREFANMVDKDVAEDREAGLERRDLANIGSEGCAESTEGCWRVEFGDFPFRLLAHELSF